MGTWCAKHQSKGTTEQVQECFSFSLFSSFHAIYDFIGCTVEDSNALKDIDLHKESNIEVHL